MRHESSITSVFLKYLRDHGWYCIKFNDRITSGIPDATAIGFGRTMWLEFKRVEEQKDKVDFSKVKALSKLQVETLQAIENRAISTAKIVLLTPKKDEDGRYVAIVEAGAAAWSYNKKFPTPVQWLTELEAERWLRK